MEKLITKASDLYEADKRRFCFGRTQRLLNAPEYKSVFDNNNYRASHKHALMLAQLNEKKTGRLGLVIGKKNVRRSVDRNRIKRITREYFRHQQERLRGFDTILVARPGLAALSNKDFVAMIAQLIESMLQQHSRKLRS